VAKPDLSIAEKEEPTFSFHVSADVTDSAGETRSDERRINVGYTALQASISADDWQTQEKPVELKLTTQTLDGDGQSAKGSLKIYRLKEPAQVERPPLSGAYRPFSLFTQRGKTPASPLTPLRGEGDEPNHWELGPVVAEK